MAQQRARRRQVTHGYQSADAAGGDWRAACKKRLAGAYREAEFAAKYCETCDVRLCIVTKAKGLTLMNLDGAQAVAQHCLGEVARGPLAQILREGKHQHAVKACCSEQVELDGQRGDERQTRSAVEHVRGMRIKGDGH